MVGGRLLLARSRSHCLFLRFPARAYNHSSRPAREAMLALYEGYWFAKELRHGRNPIRTAANYKQSRGMAIRTDLRDWLGGYPYEYATADEIVRFCEQQLGLRSIKVLPVPGGGTGNNEFVFTGPGEP